MGVRAPMVSCRKFTMGDSWWCTFFCGSVKSFRSRPSQIQGRRALTAFLASDPLKPLHPRQPIMWRNRKLSGTPELHVKKVYLTQLPESTLNFVTNLCLPYTDVIKLTPIPKPSSCSRCRPTYIHERRMSTSVITLRPLTTNVWVILH